jgi:hypothetical protein
LLLGAASSTVALAQASFTPFGASCLPGMTMAAANVPRLGQTFDLRYTGPIGSQFFGVYDQVSQPVLLLGASATQAGAVPLPAVLPLVLTGGVACEIAVSPDTMVLLPTASAPIHQFLLPIPNQPQLLGFTFHVQWLLIMQRSTFGQELWTRLLTSNGGTAVVGT